MKLYELAKLIRSKNAGPFMITIDIIFPTEDILKQVVKTDKLNSSLISQIYGMKQSDIQSFICEKARAIKFSFPRMNSAGNFYDSDVFGGQQHGPLVDLELPINK